MYTRQEASKLRQEFWTVFGQYMAPIPGADGERVNWVNYKTGINQVYFRMNADTKIARIAIELTHSNPEIRNFYYEQFKSLRPVLETIMQEEWTWQQHAQDGHGKEFDWIGTEKTGFNVFRKDDWPEFISFFKPRMIALDEFWSTAKYSFDQPG